MRRKAGLGLLPVGRVFLPRSSARLVDVRAQSASRRRRLQSDHRKRKEAGSPTSTTRRVPALQARAIILAGCRGATASCKLPPIPPRSCSRRRARSRCSCRARRWREWPTLCCYSAEFLSLRWLPAGCPSNRRWKQGERRCHHATRAWDLAAHSARQSQRRPDRAHQHLTARAILGSGNKSTDHHVFSRVHESARADVRQLRVRPRFQVVRFHQPDARPVVLPADDGGVSAGRQRRHNG